MPSYRFKCEKCALEFERKLKMGTHPDHPCPECGVVAPRLFAGANVALKFAQGSSPVNNSGFHDLDYPTADKAVGRESEVRWEGFAERDRIKRKVREKNNQGALVRKDVGEGGVEYRSMGAQEKKARDSFFKETISTTSIDKQAALVEARKKPFE
jgi:putative FmdB family regulatory protein